MSDNAFSISGVVKDGITQQPLKNQSLLCLFENTYLITATDQDGYYCFRNLPNENVYLYNLGNDYANMFVSLDVDHSYTDVDLLLGPRPDTVVSGKIMDGETARSISNYKIVFVNDIKMRHYNSITDENGRFIISGIQPGVYKYGIENIFPDIYTNSVTYGNLFYVNENTNGTHYMIPVRKGALVCGYVKTPDGSALENLDIAYIGENSRGYMSTDCTGFYIQRVPLGNYFIAPRFDESVSALTINFSVQNVDDTVHLDDMVVYDMHAGSSISGMVQNPEDLPKQGVFKIMAFESRVQQDPNIPFEYYEIAATVLEQAGAFEINALPEDTEYDLWLTAFRVTEDTVVDLGEIILPFAAKKEGADLNGDCIVNIGDVQIFTDQWLVEDQSDADFDQTGLVNFADFKTLAEYWLFNRL